MNKNESDLIKKYTLIAIFSVEELFENLFLKGRNALAFGYDLGHRGSYDLDFSMREEFAGEDLEKIMFKLKDHLKELSRPKVINVSTSIYKIKLTID